MLQTGKVAGVYARLPPASARNYDELKKDLFERFEVTNEESREKFRTSKSDENENFSQFSTRIDNLLYRWIELSKTEKPLKN